MQQRQGSSATHKIEVLNTILEILDDYIQSNRGIIYKNLGQRRDVIIQIADAVYRCVRSTYQRECDVRNQSIDTEFLPNNGLPFPPLAADLVSHEDLEANYHSTLQNIMTQLVYSKSGVLRDFLLSAMTDALAKSDPDEDGEVSCEMQTKLKSENWALQRIDGKQYLCLDRRQIPGLTHVNYRVLDGNLRDFTSEPIASISANLAREVILFDPHSPMLKYLYDELNLQLRKSSSGGEISDVLTTTIAQVRKYLDPQKANTELQQVIQQESRGVYNTVQVLDLEDFIKHRIGVCRHNSLLLAFFLEKLQADGILPAGTIMHARHYRGNDHRHVWVMYRVIESNALYLVDSTWDLYGDLNKATEARRLRNAGYGNAIDKCLARFDHKKMLPTLMTGSQHQFFSVPGIARVTMFRKLCITSGMQIDPAKSVKTQAETLYSYITSFITHEYRNQRERARIGLIVPVSREWAHKMYHHNQTDNTRENFSVQACVHTSLYAALFKLFIQRQWASSITLLPLTCMLESFPELDYSAAFKACADRDLAEIARFMQNGCCVFGVSNPVNPKQFYFGDDPPKWWLNASFHQLGDVIPYDYLLEQLSLLAGESRRVNPDYAGVLSAFRVNTPYNLIENMIYRMKKLRVVMKKKHKEQIGLLENALCLILGVISLKRFQELLANCRYWRAGTLNAEVKQLIELTLDHEKQTVQESNSIGRSRLF